MNGLRVLDPAMTKVSEMMPAMTKGVTHRECPGRKKRRVQTLREKRVPTLRRARDYQCWESFRILLAV